MMKTLELEHGELIAAGLEAGDTEPSLQELNNIGDYLSLFGADLIRRLNTEYQPHHHPVNDDMLPLLGELKRPLFNAQAHVVTALMKGFEEHRRLLLIGEPGTGKTAMSIATFFALLKMKFDGKGRVLYMVPNHLIKKTKREIGVLLDKQLFDVHFIRDYVDVIRLRDSGKMNSKPTKMEVYIIARDTAKLGYIYEIAAKWVDRTYTKRVKGEGSVLGAKRTAFRGFVCPECGGQLMKEEDGSMVPMEWDDFHNKHGKATRRKNNLFCSTLIRQYKNADPDKDSYRPCGAPLWQAKNKDKSSISGERRKVEGTAPRKVSPADLFKRYFKNKFEVVFGDEVHELAGGSAQAHAFHVFMGCAKYSVAMTGTLLSGYSSSIFELLFRMFPDRLRKMGFQWGEVGRWIDYYGLREKITKIKKDNALNSSSNGSSKRTNTKELPAAAPQLFTDMLSDVACFIQMSDMFERLPELKEYPATIPLQGYRNLISCITKVEHRPGRKTKPHKGMRLLAPKWYLERNLKAVEDQLREAVVKELQGGGQSVLLGSLLSTSLSYPDVPFNFKGVYHPDTGEEIVSPDYRLSDRLLYPKELDLIQFVRKRLKLGRKVGVYATFTGELGTLERLQMLFEERGIKTAVLTSDVDGPEREEWIAKREQEGVQVLLVNPILVSTGLDLYNFPSLYFYQTGYRLSIVRQASRRHWRIGQMNTCETVYAGYKDSMQELAINLMGQKMNAALAIEGQFSQEGLSALTEGSGGSLTNELAKRFVGNNIEGVESAESIWGKMSFDPTQLAIVAPTAPTTNNTSTEEEMEAGLTISNVAIAASPVPASGVRMIYAASVQEAILDWASEEVPADLFARIEQQITFVEENVLSGFKGLSIAQESHLSDCALVWDPTAAPSEEADFRRWVYSLTNKPIAKEVKAGKELSGFELAVVEGKKAKTRTKKAYNVTDGQYAFVF
ncbi:DEAD/DEAH box helicase family protein [Paenibacillus sp. MMO-177]|uniref:DEAD/DEAH box helicase family protein n=1 Tax=Paenibacillus sp. MMO-177 TaxID=3081289 RepID=UPI00301AB67F